MIRLGYEALICFCGRTPTGTISLLENRCLDAPTVAELWQKGDLCRVLRIHWPWQHWGHYQASHGSTHQPPGSSRRSRSSWGGISSVAWRFTSTTGGHWCWGCHEMLAQGIKSFGRNLFFRTSARRVVTARDSEKRRSLGMSWPSWLAALQQRWSEVLFFFSRQWINNTAGSDSHIEIFI